MKNQYIYGQPIYATNPNEPIEGVGYGTYEAMNYQEKGKSNNTVNANQQNIVYQTYEEMDPIYLDQNQQYEQQVYLQGDIINQTYENQQPEVHTGEYQQYYEIQQPYQEVITHYQQQPQTIAQQQAKIAQQKVKYSKQIASQPKQVIQQQQVIQPAYASRNPHIKQPQYQQPINPHFVEGSYVHEPKNQDNEGPQIESDFQPEIPLANSILTQSKLNPVPAPVQKKVIPQQPQIYQQPQNYKQPQNIQQPQNFQQSYVIPRRNPNLKIKQYQYINNDSHYVTSIDPGSSTIPINPNINSMAQTEKKDYKDSKISEKSLEANYEPTQDEKNYADGLFNKTEETKVGVGNSNIMESVPLNETQNIGKSDLRNIEPKMSENFFQSKIPNEEIEKEKPIEEKSPDENSIDNLNNLKNLNNENDAFPQEINNQNQIRQSNMGDIDDNLDHLPTIGSIMKGKSGMLPPPKKKKYS